MNNLTPEQIERLKKRAHARIDMPGAPWITGTEVLALLAAVEEGGKNPWKTEYVAVGEVLQHEGWSGFITQAEAVKELVTERGALQAKIENLKPFLEHPVGCGVWVPNGRHGYRRGADKLCSCGIRAALAEG